LRLLAALLQRLPIEMTRATFPVATSTSWTKTFPLGPTDQGEEVITIEHHGLGRPSGTLLTRRWDQNPSGSFTKIAVIRPGEIALLMTRTLFTPLGTT
jgi:hypothetical protein